MLLKNIDFSNEDFTSRSFKNTVFENCTLPSNLSNARLEGSQFFKCNLLNVDLRLKNLTDCNFYNCTLPRMITSCNLTNAYFSECTTSGDDAEIERCAFIRTRFNADNRVKARFNNCDFSQNLFTKSNFKFSTFTDCNFRGDEFMYSDLSEIIFTRCQFEKVLFVQSNLSKTYFNFCEVVHCEYLSSHLFGATFKGSKINCDLVKCERDFRVKVLLDAVKKEGCKLDMDKWHKCETVHCLAGWVCYLHPQGRMLEKLLSTPTAASLILASCGETIPDFYNLNQSAAMRWVETGVLNCG